MTEEGETRWLAKLYLPMKNSRDQIQRNYFTKISKQTSKNHLQTFQKQQQKKNDKGENSVLKLVTSRNTDKLN